MGCQSLFLSHAVSEKLLDCKANLSNEHNDQQTKSAKYKATLSDFIGWEIADPLLFHSKNSQYASPKIHSNAQNNNSNSNTTVSASTLSSSLRNQPCRSKAFRFQHYEDTSQYIDQYRLENSSTSSAKVSQQTPNKLLNRANNNTVLSSNASNFQINMHHGSSQSLGNIAMSINSSSETNQPAQQPSSSHLPLLQDDVLNNLNITNSNHEKNSSISHIPYTRVTAANASYINGIYSIAQKYHLTPPTLNQFNSWAGLKPCSNQIQLANYNSFPVKPNGDLSDNMTGGENGISLLHGKPLNLEPKRRPLVQSGGSLISQQGRGGLHLTRQPESNLPRTAGIVNAKGNIFDINETPAEGTTLNNAPEKPVKDGNSIDFARILEEKLLQIQKVQGHSDHTGPNKRGNLSRQASATRRLVGEKPMEHNIGPHRRFEPDLLYQQLQLR